MKFNVDILFSGFSGKLPESYLGWATWALVQDGTHNILLDTGYVGLRLNFHDILAKRNLSVEEIDYVLLTHLHFDHACNVNLLPNAKFVLSKKEWEYANKKTDKDLFIEEGIIPFLEKSEKIFVEKDNEEILPGITSLLTPGHTPGCCSYVLHQENGEKWVLAGDAAKNRGELKTEKVQMSVNQKETLDSIRKIKKTGNRILPGHDGWVTMKEGEVIAEGGNDVNLMFSQGITVNGGKDVITIQMD